MGARSSHLSRSADPHLPHPALPGQRDDPPKALASFQKIVNDEQEKGEQTEYGFKALKQMTKLSFKTLHDYDKALAYYNKLLTYTKKAVTRNVAEKGINGILDYVSAESSLETGKMQQFYEVTMTALEEAKNEVSSTDAGFKMGSAELTMRCSNLTAIEHQNEPEACQVVARPEGVQQAQSGKPSPTLLATRSPLS